MTSLPPRPHARPISRVNRIPSRASGFKPFENWSNDAARISALDRLVDADRKRYLRALLYPARFLYSWTTGSICSNDEAVSFLQRQPPAGLDVDLIARALQCRIGGGEPAALFAERSKLRQFVEVCRALSVGRAPG